MRVVRRCLVYGRDLRASENHMPSGVTAAVRKLTGKFPSSMINVDELDAVVKRCALTRVSCPKESNRTI